MKFARYCICLLNLAWMTSCSLYEKPQVVSSPSPEIFRVQPEPSEIIGLHHRWWENFHDPDLNNLVSKGLENNIDYTIALKNIDIAQTYVLQNMTNLFPQLGANYELSRNKGLANVGDALSSAPELTTNRNIFNLQTLTATVSYELDIWNQVHNSVEQAKSDKDVAQGNADVVRLTLVSAIVNTYHQILTLTESKKLIESQIKHAREILELKEVQAKAELINDSEVYMAKNSLETFYSSRDLAEKQIQIYTFTLAYLLGEYPESFDFKVNKKISTMHFDHLMPEAIPAVMLANRPDIQSAYSSVLSYGYIEKQNIANFLPNLTLSGTYGYANNAIANLINSSNALWNFGLNAVQAIVDYPALYSQWKRSQIQFESSLLSYKNTLINAYTEVDGAMVSYKKDKLVRLSYNKQKNNQAEIVEIAKAHYESGLTDYIDYLENKIQYLNASLNYTQQTYVLSQDIVQIYKTLGLGIDERSVNQQSG